MWSSCTTASFYTRKSGSGSWVELAMGAGFYHYIAVAGTTGIMTVIVHTSVNILVSDMMIILSLPTLMLCGPSVIPFYI